MILLAEIKGAETKKIYGKAGDEVKLIKEYFEFYIVQNKQGEKFFVRQHQVKKNL